MNEFAWLVCSLCGALAAAAAHNPQINNKPNSFTNSYRSRSRGILSIPSTKLISLHSHCVRMFD